VAKAAHPEPRGSTLTGKLAGRSVSADKSHQQVSLAERASRTKLVWLQVQNALVEPFPAGSRGFGSLLGSLLTPGGSTGRATRHAHVMA
jgi:hypothetical protein